MERIGIYGGTFNPIHRGHVQAAQFAIAALKLDRLLMMPDRIAPHKPMPADSPAAQQRLQMVQLAVRGIPGTQACDLELRRSGPSYTFETVEQLRQLYPDAKLILLMGSDMFLSFHSWKNPQQILQQVSLGVFCRGGKGEKTAVMAQKARMEADGAEVFLLDNPVLEISSTQLRRMLVFECADSFLPEGVGDYIRSHGLYGTGRDYKNLPMERLEQVVVSLLHPNRVRHVLGCRDTARELAKLWGANENDAARAGLLHDITKVLDGPVQLTLCGEYGTILDSFSQKNPKTLHALTGSMVADRIFGENEAVVSAICCHTTGKADMNLLEKIIYVADYMEPNRDFPGVEKLRELAYTDMDAALELGLTMTLDMLISRNQEISPGSREALSWLQARKNENNCSGKDDK